MAYYVSLFSPETFEAFRRSTKSVAGFRARQRKAAQRVEPGAKLLCYVTGLSRWAGLLKVVDGPFDDSTPIFAETDDPFSVRFHVRPDTVLDLESAIPIHEPDVWQRLSFTRDHDPQSSLWTGKVRTSLAPLDDADGQLVEKLLNDQKRIGRRYPFDETDTKHLTTHTVERVDGKVAVTVPEPDDRTGVDSLPNEPELRESFTVQAKLAAIGAKMGFRIWLPRGDRSRIGREWPQATTAEVPDRLPLNYDGTTLSTIENIDVLWLSGRSIVRAFEVEHTTSIYSGILRMADLLALQPNMDIRLHIVAPATKRDKFFQELRRPVFSLLERKPLSAVCSFIAYESVWELSGHPHLVHLSDTILDEFAEEAE